MHFGDYLYFALFLTALCAIPGAVIAMPGAWRHYHQVKESGGTKVELRLAVGSLLVSAGVFLHALEELQYKASRIWQMYQGVDTLSGSEGWLNSAAITGIASLSFAVIYLNLSRPKIWVAYLILHLIFAASFYSYNA